MMSLFTPKCPVADDVRAWIESGLRWMVKAFEFNSAREVTVVLPTPEYFPDPYSRSEADIRKLFLRVCEYMEVDAERLELLLVPDEADVMRNELAFGGYSGGGGAAGEYQGDENTAVVKVKVSQAQDPMTLVAVIAHELGHVLLLGDNKLSHERKDHESLTDLLTVALGMGIFNANACFRFGQWNGAGVQGWRAQRLGYLTEQMWGYALAYFASLRQEKNPPWGRYLEGDVKHYFKAGLKYLAKTKDASVKNDPSGS